MFIQPLHSKERSIYFRDLLFMHPLVLVRAASVLYSLQALLFVWPTRRSLDFIQRMQRPFMIFPSIFRL